jgi:hypothetical protein|tara:strand:+ start:71 stop:244 length:174 start_codon:yes stop_codon:yes gene_type:complete
MKKFTIKESFLGKKIMGKDIGVINLTLNTTQKDLKKLNNNGFAHILDVVIDEPKEDK